jgi:formylglycine-generating enzyme required for sulfatase activity/serine/threonine protein phosphatase PrpC
VELNLEISGDQIAGARDYQEDAFLTTYLDDESGGSKSSALIVVADGMGGHAAGNIASNLVVSTFNKTFTGKFGKQEPPRVLREALKNANEGLKESIEETPGLDGMGCTMVTAAITKGKVFWISVGDSHVYLIRDREITKKNEDHSYGGYLDRMRSQGIDVEAEAGLSRNMLMSAMTGEEIAEVDCSDAGYQLLPGDRLIIASDGLDTLESETILKTSAWSHTPKECVSGLLKAVEEANRPRQDNTTIVVVDVLERQLAEVRAPAPQVAAAAVEVASVRAEFARERDLSVAPGGGKKGLIFVFILLLAAGAGGGYVYMTGMWRDWLPKDQAGTQPPPTPPALPVQPEPAPPVQPAQPVQPESAPPVQPAQPQPAQPEPAPPEQIPPTAVEEFQDTLKSGGKGPVMARIPAGSFEMGSPNHSVEVSERPKRTVDVPAFAMGKYEVSYAEYERFARATRRKVPKSLGASKKTLPVVFVSWDDALAYTQWLSSQTGKKYRLPSEAQWEYAALADTATTYWWGRELGSGRAHCFNCDTGLNPRSPTSVGRFPANLFGLHDTAGNVAEWVSDCWHPNYQDAPTDGSVWEGGDCTFRVARGGSFLNTGKSIRAKKRRKWKSQRGYDSVGFRVVREP